VSTKDFQQGLGEGIGKEKERANERQKKGQMKMKGPIKGLTKGAYGLAGLTVVRKQNRHFGPDRLTGLKGLKSRYDSEL
jgi:hypothetical protein